MTRDLLWQSHSWKLVVQVARGFRGLRKKILSGYLILVLIIASVGVWSIYTFFHLNRVLAQVTRQNYMSVLAAENMIGALERQDSAELLVLLGEVRSGNEVFQRGREDFAKWLGVEVNNITLPNEGAVVNKLRKAHQRYLSVSRELYNLAAAGNLTQARALYLSEAEPLFKSVRNDLQDLLEMNHLALLRGNERSRRTAQRATVSTALVTAGALVIAVLFGLGLSRAVVMPTVRLTEAVRRVRDGHLDQKVPVEPASERDEIGELALEFNRMVSRLRQFEQSMAGKVVAEQEKALAIVNTIDDGAILTDEQQRIVMMNPAAETILGVTAASAVGADVWQATQRPEIVEMLRAVLSTGRPPHNRTVMYTVNGENHYFDAEVAPLVHGEVSEMSSETANAVTGSVILLKDVTYFKRLEHLKADFLSDVSHEIRTPLTSITLGIGLLRESKTIKNSERDRELLETVSAEAEHLTTLASELLEISRLESGQMKLKLQETSLIFILESGVSAFAAQAETQKVMLQLEADPGVPRVRMDPDRIRSVVYNLTANALRYAPSGSIIQIRASRTSEGVLVTIHDEGPGVPPTLKDKIFDRFYQVKGRPGGLAGLGLPISKAIVEAHKGSIWMDSGEGKGTTFSFVLPVGGPGNIEDDHS